MKKHWLDRYRTHWQWYRDFFSVGILRYFVLWFSLVPLVVHTLGSLPAVIPAPVGNAVIIFKPQLPFNWVLLWLASVCYTAALFVFAVRCPDFIKKYPSFQKYLAHGHSPRWIVWLAHDVSTEGRDAWTKLKRMLREKGYAVHVGDSQGQSEDVKVTSEQTYFEFSDGDGLHRLSMPVLDAYRQFDSARTEFVEREVFWEVFGAQSGSRRWSRGAIVVLLLIALVLFMAVLAQHVWAAIPFVVEELVDLVLPVKMTVTAWFVR